MRRRQIYLFSKTMTPPPAKTWAPPHLNGEGSEFKIYITVLANHST